MKSQPTERDLQAEAVSSHLAEMLVTGAISEDEYHALADTWKLTH